VQVQPFTNYNVSVVDKSLKNNSYISLINSNVSMFDNPFRANVTATEFQIRDKTKSYALAGKGGFSARGEDKLETGFYGDVSLKKNKGNFQFGFEQSLYSDTYNPNDLGYLQNNNEIETNPWVYYQIIEPFSIFREMNGDLWYNYGRIYNPNVFSKNEMGYDYNVTFKNNYEINLNGGYQTDSYDYFEPRVKGRFYKSPRLFWNNINFNTDWRKPLNFYLYYGCSQRLETDQYENMGELEASLRIGQHFKIDGDIYYSKSVNDVGFVDKNNTNDIINFAKRDVYTINNVLSISYVFNDKISMNIRGRHYWSGAENKDFYLLRQDGTLSLDPSYSENQDQNYNAFTIDMTFRWVFAPGSELALAWKDAAYTSTNEVEKNYLNNLQDSWLSQSNSISLKVLYYIDYNKLKRK
jgi:hypothetical protein